jgi:hypothetical protein
MLQKDVSLIARLGYAAFFCAWAFRFFGAQNRLGAGPFFRLPRLKSVNRFAAKSDRLLGLGDGPGPYCQAEAR